MAEAEAQERERGVQAWLLHTISADVSGGARQQYYVNANLLLFESGLPRVVTHNQSTPGALCASCRDWRRCTMPHDQRVPPALAHRHHMRCLAERLQPLPLGGQVRRDLQLAQKRVEVIVICTEEEEVTRAAGP